MKDVTYRVAEFDWPVKEWEEKLNELPGDILHTHVTRDGLIVIYEVPFE